MRGMCIVFEMFNLPWKRHIHVMPQPLVCPLQNMNNDYMSTWQSGPATHGVPPMSLLCSSNMPPPTNTHILIYTANRHARRDQSTFHVNMVACACSLIDGFISDTPIWHLSQPIVMYYGSSGAVGTTLHTWKCPADVEHTNPFCIHQNAVSSTQKYRRSTCVSSGRFCGVLYACVTWHGFP